MLIRTERASHLSALLMMSFSPVNSKRQELYKDNNKRTTLLVDASMTRTYLYGAFYLWDDALSGVAPCALLLPFSTTRVSGRQAVHRILGFCLSDGASEAPGTWKAS